jgi:hypothetical protein
MEWIFQQQFIDERFFLSHTLLLLIITETLTKLLQKAVGNEPPICFKHRHKKQVVNKKQKAGSRKQEGGRRKEEAERRKEGRESRKQEAGRRKEEGGRRSHVAGSKWEVAGSSGRQETAGNRLRRGKPTGRRRHSEGGGE